MGKSATQGTRLLVEDPANAGQWLNVGNLTRIQTPSPEKPEIDVTDFDSTGSEFMLGIPDFGNLDFTGWYNKTTPGQALLKADSISTSDPTRNFKIELVSQNEQVTFPGKPRSFVIEAALNSAYTFNGQIRTTGAPSFAVLASA